MDKMSRMNVIRKHAPMLSMKWEEIGNELDVNIILTHVIRIDEMVKLEGDNLESPRFIVWDKTHSSPHLYRTDNGRVITIARGIIECTRYLSNISNLAYTVWTKTKGDV